MTPVFNEYRTGGRIFEAFDLEGDGLDCLRDAIRNSEPVTLHDRKFAAEWLHLD